jgi:DNA-binding MurR/RpiR family transcriptional regulator
MSRTRTQIKSCYPELSKTEKKIADYCLEHSNKVIYFSVIDLAEAAEVSETSIFRFCKKLGYKGYPEFKLMLAQETIADPEVVPDDGNPLHYIEALQRNIISKIDESHHVLDKDALHKAIEAICTAKRLFAFGISMSGIAALIAENRFLRIGRIMTPATDGHAQNMIASVANTDDVILAFSITGATNDLLDSLRIAKENGATVISATSYVKSPMRAYTDILLQTSAKEHLLDGGSLACSISQLFILDVLVNGVDIREGEITKAMRERTTYSVIDKSCR